MDAGTTLAMPQRIASPAGPRAATPAVSNTRLAMIIVVGTECMFFAGLIGAYLVFRLAAAQWPPADLPRLPLGVTALNTFVLFSSVLPMTRALRAVRRVDPRALVSGVRRTAVMGLAFLVVQGVEWARLVDHGFTLASGTYGATFYVLIGCHALHVLVAVTWLAVVALLAARGRFTRSRHAGLEMCAWYWYFVCGLWAVLFPLVYLY